MNCVLGAETQARRLLRLLLAALVLAGLARTQSAGVSVAGVVQDPSNAPIPAASVVLATPAGSQVQTTATNASGAFRFDRVPPGEYQVRVQHDGFNLAAASLHVGARPPAPLKVTLTLATVRQEVTVSEETTQVNTDTSQNLDAVSMDRQALDDVPIFDQDYVGTMSQFLDSNLVGTSGATLVVDGLEATSAGVTASAIQEVRINQNPYSAEFPRPGRGRIEIITKPGAPQYHGAFNFLFRDNYLNARNAFAAVRPAEQRRIFEGYLTGPAGHSQMTSFLISAHRQEEDSQSIVFAQGVDGAIRQNVPSPSRNTQIAGRINHNYTGGSSISLLYDFKDRTNNNQNVGGLTLPEAGVNTQFREDELRWTYKAVVTPVLLNDFTVMFGRAHAPTFSISPGPQIVVQGAFTGGGAQADQLRTENHVNLSEIASWTHGRHYVRAGFQIPDFSRRGLDDNTNRAGTFYFSTLQDYMLNRPYSFVQQQGDGRVVFTEHVFGGFVQDEIRLLPNLSVSAGLRYDWQNYFHDNDNFAPRISFAYSPDRRRKTVFRGGAGVFYDRTGPGPIFDLLRFDGTRLRRYVITDPGFPDPLSSGGPLAAQPTSIVRLAPDIRIPYTLQYSFAVERQLQRRTTLTVTYFGTRGVSLFRSRDLNAPPPPLYAARPDPDFSVIRQIESSGRSETHSLEVSLRGNVSRYFNGMIQYTYGRAYNNTSGINYFPANNYDLSGEWSRADWDQRHRLNLFGTIKATKLFNLGVALWMHSGAPYTMTTGFDDNHDGVATDRPPGVPRNSLQGPFYADFDLRWWHDFLLEKSKKEKGPVATIGLDAFNVINRVNYTSFVGDISSPFFGRAVSAQPPRRLQASFRLRF